jgi:hypothetical protein
MRHCVCEFIFDPPPLPTAAAPECPTLTLMLHALSFNPSAAAFLPVAGPYLHLFASKTRVALLASSMRTLRLLPPPYLAALLPLPTSQQARLLSSCARQRPSHPVPPSPGTPIMRVPASLIITPSLATHIILSHNLPHSTSSLAPSNSCHALRASASLLDRLSPLAILSSAIAIIRHCSSKHGSCPICSPHTLYTSVLGQATASSFLAIDDSTFELHVRPFLINTPLAQSLLRARLELRTQSLQIAELIGLHVDDVIWAFRCTSHSRGCTNFSHALLMTIFAAMWLHVPWPSPSTPTLFAMPSCCPPLPLLSQTSRVSILRRPNERARTSAASRPWYHSPIFATILTRVRCLISMC